MRNDCTSPRERRAARCPLGRCCGAGHHSLLKPAQSHTRLARAWLRNLVQRCPETQLPKQRDSFHPLHGLPSIPWCPRLTRHRCKSNTFPWGSEECGKWRFTISELPVPDGTLTEHRCEGAISWHPTLVKRNPY